ncbi:NAD(P)/FAD-dependent oxidoreductase [Desulfoscipio gibsoniae]|uniref:Flavoprotein, HI0933 family n=1 Tax=Desulfoscipio gibsoniae DSM 7213 TaxID=767817 RepID=R4KAT7_9FIRM|nr:NAD(P)/FAD-dependent oxidoreductase [Desulfoscipio gibsoniae]AGK99678.1 flavoprotein, HI0933 family [Desulfoscipio gibsoniae DSM 7213]
MDYDVIVIGGGPAGMLSASTAAARGLQVVLLEKNDKLGRKLFITGKGRCNVTNNGDMDDFFDNIITNPKFLYSALKAFDNHGLMALLASLGVPTKIERGNRVFPASDKSSDVIKALQKHLQVNHVDIKLQTIVKKILVKNNRVAGVLLNSAKQISAPKVVLSTGGMSYQQTGSTGDGYKMARQLGHSIVEPKPALVPLVTGEGWVKDLQGLTLKNVSIKAIVNNQIKAEQFGEMIFTHFGLSGPIILSLSSLIKEYINTPANKQLRLSIDLKPALEAEQLDARLQRDFNKYSGKHLKNALDDLLPQKMIAIVLRLSGLDIHKQVNQISKKERSILVQTLKNITLTITGTRPLNEAIITSGGINVKEINPSTLESKIIKGLYFAGEIIDVDALTGGYNLQIAFSTGYLSGLSTAKA